MSCWRKYTADVMKDVDKDMLHEACKRMGFDFDETKKSVSSSWEDREEPVDAVFVKNDEEISLGFIFNGDGEGHLTVEGDFWDTGLNESQFMGDLGQNYAAINLKNQLELGLGMTVDVEEMQGEELIIEAYCS